MHPNYIKNVIDNVSDSFFNIFNCYKDNIDNCMFYYEQLKTNTEEEVRKNSQEIEQNFNKQKHINKLLKDKIDNHSKKLDKHDEILDTHSKKLDEHDKIFDKHSKKLNDHDEILDTHSQKLDDHDKILDTHSQKLDEHDEILNTHSQKLHEHDEILNTHSQKLDEHDEILNTHSQKLDDHDKILNTHSKELKNIKKELDNTIDLVKKIKQNFQFETLEITMGMEKRAFFELWSHFEKQNKNILIKAKEITGLQDTTFYRKEVVVDLPESILNTPELEILYNKINNLLKPLKDYYTQLNRVNYLNKRALEYCQEKENKDAQTTIDFSKSIPKQLNNIRYTSQLIRNFQLTYDINKIFEFKPEKWIREQFIEFADSFLREYQKAQLENYSEKMKKPYVIVMKLLKKANIEYVEILTGKTVFNSSIHIARSTVSDKKFQHNVIISVVRNGFKDSSGKYIQQPEVIVNNVR